jgi:serine/threonine protein phosphatase PrpC
MFENVRHYEKSDIGLHRRNNEDGFLVVDQECKLYDRQKFGLIFVVADGLGGHAAGEIASGMACEEAVSAYYLDDALFPGNADAVELKIGRLEKSIWSAHRKIIQAAREKQELHGMGTTLSALVLTDNKALIAHVGDSRIYRCRNNSCERMTIDHTKNQALIDTGQIRPELEDNGRCGHILTQALGGYDDLDAVFTRVEDVQSGDRFLLCTDGLHGHVTDDEIRGILRENSFPKATCDKLVQAAIGKGGHDNVTVIVIQV